MATDPPSAGINRIRFSGRSGRFNFERDREIIQAYVVESGARRMLDVPAGTGRVLDYVKDLPIEAVGLDLTKEMLANNIYTGIATHDTRIIDAVIDYANRNGIGRDKFEFQMLYGIATNLQKDLVARGYTVLIATPHGPQWYFYLMRRLAERPANVLFFLKNLLK